jgi:hypothetical protein
VTTREWRERLDCQGSTASATADRARIAIRIPSCKTQKGKIQWRDVCVVSWHISLDWDLMIGSV